MSLCSTWLTGEACGGAFQCFAAGGRDVDVISAGAGKGCALAFLLERLRAAGVGPSVVQVSVVAQVTVAGLPLAMLHM